MDAAAGITVDATLLLGFIARIWWVALRVGAMAMLAPMIGSRMLPVRARLALTVALSVALAPLVMPEPPALNIDAATFLAAAGELAIGATIGFVFRLGFEAAGIAGEFVSQGMGLSFAQMVDPLRGAQSPVVGQCFTVVAGLCFFAMDGHLALVRAVVESYRLGLPGALPAAQQLAQAVPAFGAAMFAAGLSLALPIIIAMLAINIAFGVLARTAPALNPISIGLPAAVLAGFILLVALLPHLTAPLTDWFTTTAATAVRTVR